MTPKYGDAVVGATVHDRDGGLLGVVTDVVWAGDSELDLLWIDPGFLGSPILLVPAAGADFDGEAFRLPFDRATIDQAPEFGETPLGATSRARLMSHYDQPARAAAAPADIESDADEPGSVSTIRSEERLEVGVEIRPFGRARLRKVVTVEEETVVVTVRRERLVLESAPIDEPVAGAGVAGLRTAEESAHSTRSLLTEGLDSEVVFETTLFEERAVVTTVVVPVERVILRAELVDYEETITAPVRHEHVEATEQLNDR